MPDQQITDDQKPWDATFAARLVAPLKDSWVHPNHITLLRLALSLLAMLVFLPGYYLTNNIAALLFVASNFLDHADGELSRLANKQSPLGHQFDLISDVVAHVCLFIGIGIGLGQVFSSVWFSWLGIIVGAMVVAIFGLRLQMERITSRTESRQPHWKRFEIEDVLYLLPLVTLFNGLFPFFVLACIGTPLFALFCLYRYQMIKKERRPLQKP